LSAKNFAIFRAKLRKVESKTKEFIHFFAETEYLRHFHGKDNKKESFHKTIREIFGFYSLSR